MSLEAPSRAFEAGECRLGEDGLAQRGDELAQQAPSAGAGQAAFGRGEPSSAPSSGSSRRIISRCAST
jgi:hypothetical protein